MQIRFCVASDLGIVVSHNGVHAAREKGKFTGWRGIPKGFPQASNLLAFGGLRVYVPNTRAFPLFYANFLTSRIFSSIFHSISVAEL